MTRIYGNEETVKALAADKVKFADYASFKAVILGETKETRAW